MKIQTKVHNPNSENVIGEILTLSELCHGEQDVARVLDLLVEKIARIMQSDVCSLYILDPRTGEIVLRATKGLKKESIGQVRMRMGEGLVGKSMEWMKPVSVAKAKLSKRFKYFPETGEEKYVSFLAVPLIYNRHPVGVLVIQNEKTTRYNQHMVHLLMSLAIPTVNLIEKAKLLGTLGQMKQENRRIDGVLPSARSQGMFHEGVPASSGIAIDRVKIIQKILPPQLSPKSYEPIHSEVEKVRVLEAFRWVEEEIIAVSKKAEKRFGMEEISIFDAYQMILESETFKEQILAEIDQGKSALTSIENVIQRYTDELSRADDDYIRERAYDIQDIGRKITDRLLYGSDIPREHQYLKENAILLADFWSISDLVEMDLDKVQGILSATGGASSHVAILAQSLGIPAVLGLASFSEIIHEGDTVIMDGGSGLVIVNPASEVRDIYAKEIRDYVKARKKYLPSAHVVAASKHGKRIIIGANLGLIGHIPEAINQGAEEIGLYRTEFPFMIRKSLPTEEEQTHLYQKILVSMGKKPVTLRTLDIGGDKYLPYLNLPREENPSLGWRSIRISLDREDLFRIQLRALLRASVYGKLRILFPMISSVEEIRKVKEILADVKKELKASQHPFDAKIPIGLMIEVPSAVMMAEILIDEVNFFSIGTNDLIQYTLAVDRNNAKVARLFDALHPAVLRSLSHVIHTAHRAHKTVSLCGEMAAQALAVPLLVGMKVDAMSMNAPSISKIKNLITRLDFRQVKKLLDHALEMPTGLDIANAVSQFFKKNDLDEFLPESTSRFVKS